MLTPPANSRTTMFDFSQHLPLQLIQSEAIPPAPNQSQSAIDWLPDFSGYSWIAYGASSLLVISHLPSPMSPEENLIAPIFRQVFQLSNDGSGRVSAVSWSTHGHLAAALDNCIGLFSYTSNGSFCWSQTEVLVQSTNVETIKWTNSGDGLISGGVEVILWRKNDKSWEISWKFKPELPQTLVATTYFIEGPSATSSKDSKTVIVINSDGKTRYEKSELCHPMPVFSIQWRPSTTKHSNKFFSNTPRTILLTCCIDGTVRLWSAIDDGKTKKNGGTRFSFCVSAVIEINQAMNGILGLDTFVRWAVESDSIIDSDASECHFPEDKDQEKSGKCEWIIGFGSQMIISFWAIHCLDDVSPMRFPRVTLWKKQELTGPYSQKSNLLLDKVVISRNHVFSPPRLCSFVWLLPCNSLSWLMLNSRTPTTIEEESLNETCSNRILNLNGHAGKILQVAVHFEIAASLDTNGSLLFWLISTIPNSIMGLPSLNPSWKLNLKHDFQKTNRNYKTLKWAPTILDQERVLFIGHDKGIDIFIVDVAVEKILCHYLGTIPFQEEITSIYSVLEKQESKTFFLIAVSKNKSMALSWKITINPDGSPLEKSGTMIFEGRFLGKISCISVDVCSSICMDLLKSSAVRCPINFVPYEEETLSKDFAYHMVNGCADGNLKLLKFNSSSNSNSNWEIVGTLAAHEGPILKVSLTDCGKKIATVTPKSTCSTLCIWGSVNLSTAGSFILEDELSFQGEIVCINWLTLGNGQLLLGVCLQNELRIYGQRRCSAKNIFYSEENLERNIWVCVAFTRTESAICDFFWSGPKSTAVIVHEEYFCLFSQWLFPLHKDLGVNCPTIYEDRQSDCNSGVDEHILVSKFTDSEINSNSNSSWASMKMNLKNDILSNLSAESIKWMSSSGNKNGFLSMIEVAENIGGPIPVYHPEALLMNISSGNWKRAHIALCHIIDYITSESEFKSSNLKRYCKGIPPVHLSNYLEGNFASNPQNNQFASVWGSQNNSSSLPLSIHSELSGFIERLEKFYEHAAIIEAEKIQILAVLDLLLEISNPHSASAYGSLDEPGRRFWVAVRYRDLYFFRKTGRLPSPGELCVESRLICWAFHSDCQENLFNSLLSNESSWQEMRNMGCGYWYTNTTQLRLKMEKLARQQYLKRRDPKDCALLYIALNRLQVLAGLFKISKEEKDKPLVAFLSRNFQEDKNKAAALKNAYVLMGRHQLDLACAFFLLGGDISSALTVCAKNLGDEQLSLVICHLLEGSGGPLERHLVSKILLPSSIDRCNYWSTSFFQWVVGNYTQAFVSMIGINVDTLSSAVSSNHASFLDPSIGQYCIALATKNCLKNELGEQNSALLGRWAISMTAIALNRCGLPLEALECYSSSLSIFDNLDQPSCTSSDNARSETLNEMLKPNPDSSSSNWISADVASHMESQTKVGLAMKYIHRLLIQHPSWSKITENQHYKTSLQDFQQKLISGLAYFDQKFSLIPRQLINMIIISSYNHGLLFVGYHVLECCNSNDSSQERGAKFEKQVIKITEETLYLCSRLIAASSLTCSIFTQRNVTDGNRFVWLASWDIYVHHIIQLLWNLRAALMLISGSMDLIKVSSNLLDLSEYYIYFASSWLQQNLKRISLIVKPLLITYPNGQTPNLVNTEVLKLLHQVPELTFSTSVDENVRDIKHDDQIWQIIGASLWGHISNFLTSQIDYHLKDSNADTKIQLITTILTKFIKTTVSQVSSHFEKQLSSFLHQNVRDKSHSHTLSWLEELETRIASSSETESSTVKIFDMCADPKVIFQSFAKWNSEWNHYLNRKDNTNWSDMHTDGTGERENVGNCNSSVSAVGSPKATADNHSFVISGTKDPVSRKKIVPFHNPKEIYKRNGEVFEALCINSIAQQQAVLASNRKGITFFNWDDGLPRTNTSEYIWKNADWPNEGWAGSESTPVPTCVSHGFGLGSNKGTHLGLGGATLGVDTLAKPVRDFSGEPAQAYRNSGKSHLGWEIQQDFEEFLDPPATVENVRTRAFSSHPSNPFFLVGSSNSHIYLWEFGKGRASATYGVLPAANVPPPYALASISAVQFESCGQRFATSALDGTVSTWQLEVGGRSNIRPTESSLCFNNQASDVAYVTGSGSIVAAAGYSSDGVNVVIWDTLAPSTTSRASIMCHEGGARSICVFDDERGNGSISPLIVTGGKGGDVGLHDFRYIATGRSKRNHNSSNGEHGSSASLATDMRNKNGDQNRNGMLWYIPKAHSGSVTCVSAIPNTSYFLTGSKDGDVKLWDANKSKLVYHWPKLHDRHTFMQPGYRSFGAAFRDAVTDIQVVSNGFLTCGGDGSVKLVQLKNFPHGLSN